MLLENVNFQLILGREEVLTFNYKTILSMEIILILLFIYFPGVLRQASSLPLNSQ